jgi:hypothetical protein
MNVHHTNVRVESAMSSLLRPALTTLTGAKPLVESRGVIV